MLLPTQERIVLLVIHFLFPDLPQGPGQCQGRDPVQDLNPDPDPDRGLDHSHSRGQVQVHHYHINMARTRHHLQGGAGPCLHGVRPHRLFLCKSSVAFTELHTNHTSSV